MNVKTVPIGKIKPAKYNPRIDLKPGDDEYEKIKLSIEKFGLVDPLVWNEHNGVLIGGHQRLKVLRDMQWKEVPVSVVKIKIESEEKALNIALNKIAGDWDEAKLAAILEELGTADFNMEFTGFDDKEINQILSDAEGTAGLTDPDEIPDKPKVAITKLGDIWKLGDHHVICGDSTDQKTVDKCNSSPHDMMFTDPPWNVAIGLDSNPRHRQRAGLKNDNLGVDFIHFLKAFSSVCLPTVRGDVYCVMGCGEWPNIDGVLRESGLHWSATIVWLKDAFVLGRSNYHRRFEPIWYGWPEGSKSSYHGGRAQDDVWEVPRPKVSEEHPTMKPVALVERAIKNSSLKGDCVFDPFLGAGSTLIAAETLGRSCRGIELDPGYCDVIVERWQQFTGKKAKRV